MINIVKLPSVLFSGFVPIFCSFREFRGSAYTRTANLFNVKSVVSSCVCIDDMTAKFFKSHQDFWPSN